MLSGWPSGLTGLAAGLPLLVSFEVVLNAIAEWVSSESTWGGLLPAQYKAHTKLVHQKKKNDATTHR